MGSSKTRRVVSIILIVAVLVIALPIGFSWWAGKHLASLGYERISPKKYYRVEVWDASGLSFQAWPKEYPAFIRVYDIRNNKLIKESDIIDIHGTGEIFWPRTGSPQLIVGNHLLIDAEPEPD